LPALEVSFAQRRFSVDSEIHLFYLYEIVPIVATSRPAAVDGSGMRSLENLIFKRPFHSERLTFLGDSHCERTST